jgi:DNA-directed RNA polymerase
MYFPVKMDFRGRIYIIPHYLHAQSHEVAKALLLFSRPGIIKKTDRKVIEYYKVMAANYFGNGVDKGSFNNKLI